jgi:succinoglycan biosynthesis protein ExoO
MPAAGQQTVSVIIPAWNAEAFIARALGSALANQNGVLPDGRPLSLSEVIVVDDHSADRTGDILSELAARQPLLRVITNPQNSGPAVSRNRAIAAARGDWIAILDADDAYTPGRLPRLIGVALENDLAIIADLPILYDLAAGARAPTQLSAAGDLKRLSRADLLRPDPQTGLDLGLLKPVFRRHLASNGAWRYPETLRHGEDLALYFALLGQGESFGLLHEAHYLFSTRIGEISGSYSPGSVTNVDYRAIAAHAAELAENVAGETVADPEILRLLESRQIRALQQNRIYGWTLLRKREWRRLITWLKRNAANRRDLCQVIIAKLRGHRGLPD